MKLLKLFLLLILIGHNHLFSMEAKRKSLASFFCIDALIQYNDDILQDIAYHHHANKPWLYVDRKIKLCDRKISSACFNESGTKIKAQVSDDNCLYVWHRANGKKIEYVSSDFSLAGANPNDEEETLSSEEEAEDDGIIYYSTTCEDQADTKESEWFSNKLSQYSGEVQTLRRKDGKMMRMNSAVCIWETKKKKEVADLIHQERINSVALNDISDEIVTTSDDCILRLWDGKTG